MVSGYNGRSLSHSIDGRTLKHVDNFKFGLSLAMALFVKTQIQP